MANVAGADVTIQADLDPVPFVLDVDLLDADGSVLTPTADALSDIACRVVYASWRWGAAEWRGAMTTPDAGAIDIVLADPLRQYDPGNPDVARPIQLGSPILVDVDGARAWTGYVVEVSHDHAAGLTSLHGADGVAAMAGVAYPGLTPAGTTWTVMGAILDAVGWPADLRVTHGAPAAYRAAGTDPENAWAALIRNALAEGGLLWVDRLGRIAQAARGVSPVEDLVPPVIGCDGADVGELTTMIDRDAVRNHALVEGEDVPSLEWTDAGSIAAYGRRTLRVQRDELRLALAP